MNNKPIRYEEIEHLRLALRDLKRLMNRIIRKIENPDHHRRVMKREGKY